MAETNMEKNIISEADLEKAAGGLKLDKSTLKKALIGAGVLAAGAGAAVGGYYAYNHYKKGKDAPAAPADDTVYPRNLKELFAEDEGDKKYPRNTAELFAED